MTRQQFSEAQSQMLRDRLADKRSNLIQAMADSTDPQLNEIAARVKRGGGNYLAPEIARLNLVNYASWVMQANNIERASADLRAGHYGLCDTCREFIEFERLQADPAVRRCKSCAPST